MSAPFDELTAGRRAFIARASLSELVSAVGGPGRAVLATRPDLLAEVDQHAAAVRQALGGPDLDPVALAGYAAAIKGTGGAGDTDWSHPSWTMLRLLAVCQLV